MYRPIGRCRANLANCSDHTFPNGNTVHVARNQASIRSHGSFYGSVVPMLVYE